MLPGVDPESAEILAAARCIMAAATKDNLRFDAAAIAEECGLPVEQVQVICASPAYRTALSTQFLVVASHALTNGARQMDKIVQDENSSSAAKVAAYRAIVETMKVFDHSGGKPPKDSSEDELEEWLRKNKKKHNASSG